jgi:hypothetical protein
MWSWLLHTGWLWLSRGLALAAALTLLYIALFLYETEEKQFRNRLEDAWLRIAGAAEEAGSRRLAFVREVAQIADRWFYRIFGPRLLSWRAFVVSAFLSLSAFSAAGAMLMIHEVLEAEGRFSAAAGASGMVVLVVALSLCRKALRLVRSTPRQLYPGPSVRAHQAISWQSEHLPADLRDAAVILAAYLALMAGLSVYAAVGDLLLVVNGRALTRVQQALLVGFDYIILCGVIASDVIVVAGLRAVLRYAAVANSASRSLMLFGVPLVLGLLLCVAPLTLALHTIRTNTSLGHDELLLVATLFGLSLGNVFDALVVASVCLVGLWLLLHRLIWPPASRVVWAVLRYDVLGRKRLLASIAVALVVLAIPGATAPIRAVVSLFGISIEPIMRPAPNLPEERS